MIPKTTEFEIKETAIKGLLDISVSLIEDERGWFQEKYQYNKLFSAGFPTFLPLQHNISYNKVAGVTRGVHAEPWHKYIGVISGRVFAAFVDLRLGNGFGTVVEMEIDNKRTVFVPEGVGNSFQTLVPDTIYSYLVDGHWKAELAESYRSVNLADPELVIHWPISLEDAIISDKDKKCPMLSEIK